jgi:hypothetical protein
VPGDEAVGGPARPASASKSKLVQFKDAETDKFVAVAVDGEMKGTPVERAGASLPGDQD